MRNKTIIRTKDRKAGTFTTVSLDLLHNNKLSSDARFLLIEVLSDSDEFSFSATLYADRMKCKPKHIYNKVDELIEYGYAKKTRIPADAYIKGKKKRGSRKILYHYTFSEFGNLNNLDDGKDDEKPLVPKNPIKPSDAEISNLAKLIESDYFTRIAVGVIDWNGVEEHNNNYEQFKLLIQRIGEKVPQVQKEYCDEVKNSLKDYHSSKYPLSIKKKMDERIKKVVYQEQRTFNLPDFTGALNEAQNHWARLTREHGKKQYVKNMDSETLRYDQLEQDYYDGR